jgi:hypothetical protein
MLVRADEEGDSMETPEGGKNERAADGTRVRGAWVAWSRGEASRGGEEDDVSTRGLPEEYDALVSGRYEETLDGTSSDGEAATSCPGVGASHSHLDMSSDTLGRRLPEGDGISGTEQESTGINSSLRR